MRSLVAHGGHRDAGRNAHADSNWCASGWSSCQSRPSWCPSGCSLTCLNRPSPGPCRCWNRPTVQSVPHDLPEDYTPVHRGGINLPTGLYTRRDEDLVLRGTPPLVLSRTYLSKDLRSRAFGIGTSHSFEWFLVGDALRFQEVAIIREDGSQIPFARTSSGTSYKNAMFEVREPGSDFYGAKLGWTGSDWVMRAWDGSLLRFEACVGYDKPRPCGLVLSRDDDGHVIHGRRDTARTFAPHRGVERPMAGVRLRRRASCETRL